MKLKHLKHTDTLDFFVVDVDEDAFSSIPMFSDAVQAGFPSPAEDHIDMDLNLNDHLVQNPSATFCVKAIGESMKDAGIQSGDIMIVDKSLEPQNRSIVIAVIDGEFTVKRLLIKAGKLWLQPENSDFKAIEITDDNEFVIWGIVTNVIKKV